MPLVSIILVNYNGEGYLESCINSLKGNTFQDFEIILVDNGSADGSISLARKKFPEVKLIELGENLGLSIASNKGREAALGKYLFFFNNDTVADKNMLAELVKAAEADSTIGICGCKTLTYNGAKEINCGVHMDIFGYPYGRDDENKRRFYVDAAILIKTEIFDEIDGFDEKMFLYCEDRDLCWRVWLYGYKVVAVPTATFKHDSFCLLGGAEGFSTNARRRFMNEAFTLRMLLKNYSAFSLSMILPLYVMMNLAEISVYFIKGKFNFLSQTYLKAYRWNFKNLKDTLEKRKIVQKRRKVSDREIRKHMYKISGKILLFTKVGIPNVS